VVRSFLWLNNIPRVHVPLCVYPFVHWCLLPPVGYCQYCYYELLYLSFCLSTCFCLTFLTVLQTAFQNSHTNLHSHQQCLRARFLHILTDTCYFPLKKKKKESHSSGYSKVDLICTSLVINNGEIFSRVSWLSFMHLLWCCRFTHVLSVIFLLLRSFNS
jgi:hypothetical protein